MNPFDLTGPQFLVFYTVLGLLVNMWLRRRVRGDDPEASVALSALTADPGAIAYLREGEAGAIRLAVISLLDRRLLVLDGGRLRTADAHAPAIARRTLERAVLQHCLVARAPDELERAADVRAACDAYRSDLERRGLIEGAAGRAARKRAVLTAVAVLAGVAIAKLLIALSRGRSNVVFLIVLAIIAVVAACMVLQGFRTGLGETTLRRLATLCDRLRRKADALRPGGATNEAILFAAVFGIHALPALAFPFVQEVYPRRTSGDGGTGGGDGGGDGGGGGCGGCGGGGD